MTERDETNSGSRGMTPRIVDEVNCIIKAFEEEGTDTIVPVADGRGLGYMYADGQLLVLEQHLLGCWVSLYERASSSARCGSRTRATRPGRTPRPRQVPSPRKPPSRRRTPTPRRTAGRPGAVTRRGPGRCRATPCCSGSRASSAGLVLVYVPNGRRASRPSISSTGTSVRDARPRTTS